MDETSTYWRGEMVKEFIEHLSLLGELNEEELNALLPLIEEVTCKAEEEIFKQGEEAKYFYMVVEGEVTIHFNPKGEAALIISNLGKGDMFGWSSVLGSHTYTSGAMCAKDGKLLRIKGNDLKKLCQERPQTGILIIERIASLIARRLTNTQEQVVGLLNNGLQDKKITGG